MAKRMRKVSGGEDFSNILAGLTGDQALIVMKKACFAGAGVLADALKSEIQNLPEESGYMKPGRKRNVVGTNDKKMLQERLGVSRIEATGDRATVAVSFSGYNDRPTKKYPHGVPIPLIARSIESGSSVRVKNPFIRRTFNRVRSEAQDAAVQAGQTAINDLIK